MKVVIQRVSEARVRVGTKVVGEIGRGALILLGIARNDTAEDADHLAKKAAELRMFDDEQGNLNLSAKDINGSFLVVSQFTLYGDCAKGRRPSFDAAAKPEAAEALYDHFLQALKTQEVPVQSGVFRAMMKVELVNEGPVTFILESGAE